MGGWALVGLGLGLGGTRRAGSQADHDGRKNKWGNLAESPHDTPLHLNRPQQEQIRKGTRPPPCGPLSPPNLSNKRAKAQCINQGYFPQ